MNEEFTMLEKKPFVSRPSLCPLVHLDLVGWSQGTWLPVPDPKVLSQFLLC